jgi:hypothetical protein
VTRDIDLDQGDGFIAFGRSALALKPFHRFGAVSPSDSGMRSGQT